MSNPAPRNTNLADWAAEIRQQESTGNYGSHSTTYFGACQMGISALQAAGLHDKAVRWATRARAYGVRSMRNFGLGINNVLKTASFFKDYSPAALAIVLSFFIVLGPQSSAATDDKAFNDCLQRYALIHEIQPRQVWKNSSLPEDIKESMPSYPLVESFTRWTKVRNQNGTTTVIVMARGVGPQDEDAQDGFYVLLQRGDRIDLADNIAANAAFFAKQSSYGIYGIFFCTQGDLGSQEPLLWNGQSWN